MESMVGLSFKQLKELEVLRHENRMEELKFEKAMTMHRLEEELGAIRLRMNNERILLEQKDALKEKWNKRFIEQRQKDLSLRKRFKEENE